MRGWGEGDSWAGGSLGEGKVGGAVYLSLSVLVVCTTDSRLSLLPAVRLSFSRGESTSQVPEENGPSV